MIRSTCAGYFAGYMHYRRKTPMMYENGGDVVYLLLVVHIDTWRDGPAEMRLD